MAGQVSYVSEDSELDDLGIKRLGHLCEHEGYEDSPERLWLWGMKMLIYE